MLENVVLVVPTYNRPDFLHRLLSYHSQSYGLQIVVGDGSDAAHLARNKEVIDSFAKKGLDIIHYTPTLPPSVKPGLEGAYGYAERQVNGAKLSSRPFVHVTADDDFVSPEFLREAAAFLLANPDYSAVSGYVFSFELDQPGAQGSVKSRTFTPFCSTARPEARALDRISRNEMVPMTVLEYACFRRNAFELMGRTMLQLAEKAMDVTDLTSPKVTTFTLIYLYDVISDQLTLALGKLHWLPHVQIARSFHETNWGGQVRVEYKANLGNSFVASNWPTLANISVNAVAEALVKCEGYDYAAARHIAEAGLAMRVGKRLLYEGKRRLAAEGAQQEGFLTSAPGSLRKALRIIPGAQPFVRMVLRANTKYRESLPRLKDLPSDVPQLLQFLEKYRCVPSQ